MGEWISVEDCLPEYRQDVLFVSGKNQVSVGKRMGDDGDKCEVWSCEDSIYFNDHINQDWCTCKFWMPLPEPPNTEKAQHA